MNGLSPLLALTFLDSELLLHSEQRRAIDRNVNGSIIYRGPASSHNPALSLPLHLKIKNSSASRCATVHDSFHNRASVCVCVQ